MGMINNVPVSKKCNSLLLDFLASMNNYNGEQLLYSTKYSSGTFTVSTPSNSFVNCEFINGYPHFKVPLEVVLGEIQNFLDDKPIYENDFFIRYGDTHPHKIIPKLGQMRDLMIEEVFNSMLSTSSSKRCVYAIGDISIKTIDSVVDYYYSINERPVDTQPLIDYIFKKQDSNNPLIMQWKNYVRNSQSLLISFLKENRLELNELLLESSLYSNNDMYDYLKNNIVCENGVRENGSLKYLLQELAFILTFSREGRTMINIICNLQLDHVFDVMQALKNNNIKDDIRFLTYKECKNAESRDANEWSMHLSDFINQNNLIVSGKLLNYIDFIRIVVCSTSNSMVIDFSQLEKYKRCIKTFKSVKESLRQGGSKTLNIFNIEEPNDLLNKMAMVNYYLNNSINSGEQFRFYNYIVSIKDEYCQHQERYQCMYDLYCQFMTKCLEKLSLI